MPNEAGAVFLGLSLSLVNFVIFVVLSAIALRQKETTTASGLMGAGVIARLTIVTAVYVFLVSSRFWEPRIYYVTAGFIPSMIVFLVIEIFLVVRMGDRIKR